MTGTRTKTAKRRGRNPALALSLRILVLAAALLPGVLWTAPVAAQDSLPPMLRDVSFDPQLNAALPLELEFRDEASRPVRLGNYFGSKPVVLTLVYYQCPMLCNQVLEGLASSMKVLPFDAGKQFTVVAVSFNPRETPAMAVAKKHTFLDRYRRPGASEGSHFLTGDAAAIAALTRAAGFRFAYDPKTNLYTHASGILVLTPRGRISRYFYGIEYAPRDLRLGLVEASANKIGSPVDRLLLFCYHYDPATGKYGALVIRMVRLGGILTVLGLSIFIFVFWRREGHPRGQTPGGTG